MNNVKLCTRGCFFRGQHGDWLWHCSLTLQQQQCGATSGASLECARLQPPSAHSSCQGQSGPGRHHHTSHTVSTVMAVTCTRPRWCHCSCILHQSWPRAYMSSLDHGQHACSSPALRLCIAALHPRLSLADAQDKCHLYKRCALWNLAEVLTRT